MTETAQQQIQQVVRALTDMANAIYAGTPPWFKDYVEAQVEARRAAEQEDQA